MSIAKLAFFKGYPQVCDNSELKIDDAIVQNLFLFHRSFFHKEAVSNSLRALPQMLF